MNADAPTKQEVTYVKQELITAITEVRSGLRNLPDWSTSQEVKKHRAASLCVRERMAGEWQAL